jgi:hypothetical protein
MWCILRLRPKMLLKEKMKNAIFRLPYIFIKLFFKYIIEFIVVHI